MAAPTDDRNKKIRPMDEQAEFVMCHVDHSREERDHMEDIWDETELNFLVRPYTDASLGRSTRYPFAGGNTHGYSRGHHDLGQTTGRSVLKDPETHQEVMTLVAGFALTLFGEPGFVKGKRVGFEDIYKAKTVTELLAYVHRLPTHYLTFIEWMMGMCIYGTGMMESGWEYLEEPRNFREVLFNEFGEEETRIQTFVVPVWDDPRHRVLDIRDYFPDPSNTNIIDMFGIAKRFSVSAAVARRRAEEGQYNAEAVERALEAANENDESEDKPSDDLSEMNPRKSPFHEFDVTFGYEYYGIVPFKTEDGIEKRVITVLGGETVRSDPWPRRLPFFDARIIPRLGSPFGIAPAEVIRHDQDFADTIKMMLSDAVALAVHPPHIYDKNAEVELSKLRRWSPSVPIGANRVDAIQQAPYNPPVQPAFVMYDGVKQQMREATGALGAIQGLGLGSKRFSASEAVGTMQAAQSRPELFISVIENEFLPPLGKYDFELYQEFMESTEDLQDRVGASNTVATLSDIMPRFDVQYVGSRIVGGQAQKVAAFREIAQAGANPLIQQLVPWIPLLQKWFSDLGADEIAAMVGNPQMVQLHLALNQVAGGGLNAQSGNNNGTSPAAPPVGQLPAQALGMEQ